MKPFAARLQVGHDPDQREITEPVIVVAITPGSRGAMATMARPDGTFYCSPVENLRWRGLPADWPVSEVFIEAGFLRS